MNLSHSIYKVVESLVWLQSRPESAAAGRRMSDSWQFIWADEIQADLQEPVAQRIERTSFAFQANAQGVELGPVVFLSTHFSMNRSSKSLRNNQGLLKRPNKMWQSAIQSRFRPCIRYMTRIVAYYD